LNVRLELDILRLCREAQPYQLPEQAIINQLLVRVRPPPLVTEIAAALRSLEEKMQVLGIRTDDGIKYQASPIGAARLIQAEQF